MSLPGRIAGATLVCSLAAAGVAMAMDRPGRTPGGAEAPAAPPAEELKAAVAAPAEEDKRGRAPFTVPPAITSYERSKPRGLANLHTMNLRWYLANKLGREIPALSLGPIAVLGSEALVGSDTEGQDNFLVLTTTAMTGEDSITSCLALPAGVDARRVVWIHPERALAAVGEGRMLLISLDAKSRAMKIRGELPPFHSGTIRDVVVSPVNGTEFASGGDDGRLVILDLEHPEEMQVLPQVGTIASIGWPRVNQGVCPSLTLDDGTFLIYDLRVRPAAPSFRATLGRKELFAHVRYTDNHVLLGFGDGELQHLDVRVEDRILDRVSDPFVQAIGSLDYDHATRSLLVSGIPDMLLWSHDWATGALQSACHAIEGGATTNAVSAVSGAFTDDGRVVLVTTDGSLSILKPIRPGTSHLAGGDDEPVPKRRRKLLPPLASVPEPLEAASPGRRRR